VSRRPGVDDDLLHSVVGAVFGASVDLTIERTEHGAAAAVYRVRRGDEVYFLRLAEEVDENLEVDALVHERLDQAGVRVPRVVHVDPFNDLVGRSLMVVRHIGGRPLAEVADPTLVAEVLKRAGENVAVINQQPVHGFGWVKRDQAALPLVAELPDYASFVAHDLPAPWPGGFGELFSDADLEQIEDLITCERGRDIADASLAHGDLGLDHIFERDGEYSGIIDFGEIRGTEPEFDLGVFFAHTPRENRALLVDAIMSGYRTVTPLPDDMMIRMRVAATLKSLRQLARWMQPGFGFERDPNQLAALISRRFLLALRETR
jgi:aminoglycoside phosphotransferase (APT) family kinase protein